MAEESYSVNYLFNTHLFGYILLGITFFAFLGVFWAGLFQLTFPALLGNFTFASSLDALTSLIGFAYMIWFQRQAQGYTSTYEEYRNMINYVKVAGDKLFGAYAGLPLERKTAARGDIVALKTAMQFLIFYSYRIYAPWNRDEIVTDVLERENLVTVLLGPGVYDRQGALSSHKEQIRVPKIPPELLDLRGEALEEDPIAFTHEIRGFMFREFSHLSSKDVFTKSILTFVHEDLSSLNKELMDIERSREIKRPTIFDKHLGFLLISYFGAWLPITMWVKFGFVPTVVVFPFVMIVLAGPWIYRKWLGHPFSASRPLELVAHKRWRNDAVEYLEKLFKQSIK